MNNRTLERLIECIAGVIHRRDPDPAPMTLAALEEQSDRAKHTMEEKRARALSFLAARPRPHFEPGAPRHVGPQRHQGTTASEHP